MKKSVGRPSKERVLESKKRFIKDSLNDFFGGNKRVFSKKELGMFLKEFKIENELPITTSLEEFIDFLLNNNIVIKQKIETSSYGVLKKYSLGKVSEFEIALSIRSNSYISHYSAMYLHDLTVNIPKVVYANLEQPFKPTYSGTLLQKNIDSAFSRKMRTTNNLATYGNYKIFLLNGKYTGRAGVAGFNMDNLTIPVTNIERTLIDATVRPEYAGGVSEVQNAYIAAKGKVSVNKLVSILKKIKYKYPYHQAIGYYLEKAGFSEKSLKLLEELGVEYNFYLTYRMKEKDFIDRWKLFIPKHF